MCPELTKKFSCITEVTGEKKFKNPWPHWFVDSWIITHTSFSIWVWEWFVMQQKLTETLILEMSALEHLEGTQCIFLKSQYRAHCERKHCLSFMSPLIQTEVQLSLWERRKIMLPWGGDTVVPPFCPFVLCLSSNCSITPHLEPSFNVDHCVQGPEKYSVSSLQKDKKIHYIIK